MSFDSPTTHAEFARANDLPYPLISDHNGAIASAYGVQRLGGWLPSRRVTFVIGKDGVVHTVIQSELRIDHHISAAIAALRILQAPTPAS